MSSPRAISFRIAFYAVKLEYSISYFREMKQCLSRRKSLPVSKVPVWKATVRYSLVWANLPSASCIILTILLYMIFNIVLEITYTDLNYLVNIAPALSYFGKLHLK